MSLGKYKIPGENDSIPNGKIWGMKGDEVKAEAKAKVSR